MHERLEMVRIAPHRVMDGGCGEGADLSLLHRRFPEASLLAQDASTSMLKEAAAALAGQGLSSNVICADLASLPLSAGAIDVLWSNLALHWHPDPAQVFMEWKRVLHPEGVLMFSCFGPETLGLLREAFSQVDGYTHILPFMEMHDLGDSLVAAGFPSPVLDRETLTVTYADSGKLLADVRALGGNLSAGRRRSLLGKAAWQRLRDHLDSCRDADGRISLSFEIIYGHAFASPLPVEKPQEAPLYFFPRS